jgi:recombinational DNA repair protein (RecF pathway)
VSLERPADALQRDLERLLVASYLAEHSALLAPENEPSPALFRLLDASVSALLAGGDPGFAARYFEVWALRLAGVFPASQACARCGRPWRQEGAFLVEDELVCRDCTQGLVREAGGAGARDAPLPLGVGTLRLLAEIGRSSPQQVQEAAREGFGAQALAELERVTAALRLRFLGEELRSYRVMQRALAE